MNYAQIRNLDISNGEGVGVALFVQGCSFHCKNCFNPETWDFDGGKEWTSEVKEEFLELIDRSYIKRVSILGGEPLADKNLNDVLDLVSEINKRYNTSQDIVDGKMDDHNMLIENTDKIRLLLPNKTIWLYTGYTWSSIQSKINSTFVFDKELDNKIEIHNKRQQIVQQCDVLVDGKYIDSQRDVSLRWRGSSNQNVIDIQQSLKQNKMILYCD